MVPAQADLVEDHIRFKRGRSDSRQRLGKIEPRAGGDLGQREVEPADLEIVVEEGGAADLEHVAVLRAQIVAVEQRAGAEQIDVGAFDELVAEQHIADRRMDQRRAGRDIGVGLILRAKKDIADQPLRRGLAGDFGEVLGDARAHLGRRVGRRGLCEIAPGDLERPHAEIQRAELEVDARQVGVEQQHAFERGHRRLVVAELGRRLGISEGRVEVGWVA